MGGVKRRSGTAIVDTPDGILIVSTDNRNLLFARRGR